MRAYNVMWAKADTAKEIEKTLRTAPQRVLDIQKSIEHVKTTTA